MKLKNYLQDKTTEICLILSANFIVFMILMAFKLPLNVGLIVMLIESSSYMLALTIDYLKKRNFYNKIIENMALLDKKYLVLETIDTKASKEAEILYDILYEINKSMTENVIRHTKEIEDFKDYIEMWIHEVKIPIASLTLITHNHKTKMSRVYLKELNRLDNYVEQVLYYVRSNYTEQDFIIREVKLEKVIGEVALKNKDILLEQEITFTVDCRKAIVHTDAKWLEFILNQIIDNSIKYKKPNSPYIKIFATVEEDRTSLHILDNGIGIPKSDLPNIFKKTFTGENGRAKSKSTGMGLYIAKKLCDKLGATIEASSIQSEYTEIIISFGKDDFYKI